MMHLITLQLIALVGAGFLYAYVSKNGLSKAHRIFAGLVVLAVIAALVSSLFCCCGNGRGCSMQGGNSGCAMQGGNSGCTMHEGGGSGHCGKMKKCCKGLKHGGCKHGGGSHACKHMEGDSLMVIEKELIIHDGDTVKNETNSH